MKFPFFCRRALFLVPLVLFFAGNNFVVGSNYQPPEDEDVDINAVIADMIEGGMSAREEFINSSGGIFSDYQVYRDGENDGVVFEYVYDEYVVVDRSKLTPDIVKNRVIALLSLSGNSDVTQCMDLGIYMRYLYKANGGEILCDVSVSSDDF